MASKNGKREFKHEDSGTTFTLPEPISVATNLRYYSGFVGDSRNATFLRAWESARRVIEDWQSELLPDMDVDLNTLTDKTKMGAITKLVMWVGNQVADFITEQETVEKN